MDGAQLSRFPHLSWLRVGYELRPDAGPLRAHEHSVNYLGLMLDGRHTVRWIHRDEERRWTEQAGTLHFRPCDGEHSHFAIHSESPGEAVAFYIPGPSGFSVGWLGKPSPLAHGFRQGIMSRKSCSGQHFRRHTASRRNPRSGGNWQRLRFHPQSSRKDPKGNRH